MSVSSYLLTSVLIPLSGWAFVFLSIKDLKEASSSQMERICSDGLFFLEVPENIVPQLQSGIHFAHICHQDPKYKVGMMPKWGYHSSEGMQQEIFYCCSDLFDEHLPKDVVELGENMDLLSKEVLCCIGRHLTGDEFEAAVVTNFGFNYYDPTKKCIGASPHTDSGAINLLYQIDPGLEILLKGRWFKVPQMESFFCVLLGQQLKELFYSKRVQAPIHRVPRMKEPRHSISFFAKINQ